MTIVHIREAKVKTKEGTYMEGYTMRIISRLARALVSFTLRAKWNSTLPQSALEMEALVNSAKRHVRVVSGDLEHGVFDNEQVLSALDRAISRLERPVTVEILCGPAPDTETKRIWELAKASEGRLNITELTERPKAHFVLVDEKTAVRIEQYHEPNKEDRRAYRKHGMFFLGSILREDFEDLKKSPLQPKEAASQR